jgi:hypothetical protein
MAAPADRYEPLPGLVGIPGYLLRKLSPRGRVIALWLGTLLLLGAVGLAIVLVPQISESKRERAAAERKASERALARERARMMAEQRPRRGRLGGASATALVAHVEEAITGDVGARARNGELQNPALRTECSTLGHEGGRVLLGCTAITSEAASSRNATGVVVGYRYRAAISPESGRFAFCKSGRPPVGFLPENLPKVKLPRACGG